MSATKKMYRPNELASEIGVNGKMLRNWLRANFTRPLEVKNSAWIIDEKVAKEARAHFAKNVAKDDAPDA